MNAAKKLKMEDLMKQLGEETVMPRLLNSLICPELLLEAVEDDLAYREMSEPDIKRLT